jgi:hypothetical protein
VHDAVPVPRIQEVELASSGVEQPRVGESMRRAIPRRWRVENVDELPTIAVVLGQRETQVPAIVLAVVERDQQFAGG